MIRALVVAGVLCGFIGCAHVPPPTREQLERQVLEEQRTLVCERECAVDGVMTISIPGDEYCLCAAMPPPGQGVPFYWRLPYPRNRLFL